MRAVVSQLSPVGCRICTVTTSADGSVFPGHMVIPRKSPFGSFVEKRAFGVCFSAIMTSHSASGPYKLPYELRLRRPIRLFDRHLFRPKKRLVLSTNYEHGTESAERRHRIRPLHRKISRRKDIRHFNGEGSQERGTIQCSPRLPPLDGDSRNR